MLWWEWLATEATGSGSVAAGVAVAGQASQTLAATGSVTAGAPLVAGAAAETILGAGSVAAGRAAIAGTASGGAVPVQPAVHSGLLLDPRPMRAVPYNGPTGSRQVSAADIAAATARFKRRTAEDEWVLGLITDDQWLEAS